jgi:hypothetical protein
MALGSRRPLTEMEGKGRSARMADKLNAICEPIVCEMLGASTSHNPMGGYGLLQGQFTFIFFIWCRAVTFLLCAVRGG